MVFLFWVDWTASQHYLRKWTVSASMAHACNKSCIDELLPYSMILQVTPCLRMFWGVFVKTNFLYLLCFLTSSMVIRDLTLRSAASFGSFHLIRLLYDEYMYYLIEHRVARAKGVTPIAVMGEVCVCTLKATHIDLVCTWWYVSKCPVWLSVTVCKHHQKPDLSRPRER